MGLEGSVMRGPDFQEEAGAGAAGSFPSPELQEDPRHRLGHMQRCDGLRGQERSW